MLSFVILYIYICMCIYIITICISMPMTHIVIIRQCSCSKIHEVLQILHADDDYIILFKVCNTKNTHNLHVLHAACIGGIGVHFIGARLFPIDIRWTAISEIYHTYLLDEIYECVFYAFATWGSQAFSLKIYYNFSIEPYCLCICVYQQCPKLEWKYAETWAFNDVVCMINKMY